MLNPPQLSTGVNATGRIESVVANFLEQLVLRSSQDTPPKSNEQSEGGDNSINAPRKRVQLVLANRSKPTSTKCLIYPRKSSSGSAQPFAQLFRMLDLSHQAITMDESLTKRELFYRDVALFKSQRAVDQLLDDVTATLSLERGDMNIRASSKGLVCGEGLTINLASGDCINVSATASTLIPVMEDVKMYSVSRNICWVLVVEKEAVFNVLCHLHLVGHPALLGQGLLITGKGYPDMATRHLVNALANALPQSVPMLALVDGDPYGLDILSVYKYGSQSLQHESAKLAANRLKGMGLWMSDLKDFCVGFESMLPLTGMDERKAFAMLQRTIPESWKKELMRMIHVRRKAEIEILLTMPCTSELLIGPALPGALRDPLSPQAVTYTTLTGQVEHSPFFSYVIDRINSAVTRVET